MKKLLLLLTLAAFCLLLSACDVGDLPGATTPATTPATTTAGDATTTAPVTTAAPEDVFEELKEPEHFDNVTLKMAGIVNGDAFDYDILFNESGCLMTEHDGDGAESYVEFFPGEEGDMVRSIFVDTALALLAHGDRFTATDAGYACETAITYECDVLGVGHATITASEILVTQDEQGKLNTLTCKMLQVCEDDPVNVSATFTFSHYGTTAFTPPTAE